MRVVAVLFSLIFFLYACCPLVKQSAGELLLSIDQKNAIPYLGNEVLVFRDAKGNTKQMKADGREVSLDKWDTSQKESCEYYKVETDITSFGSEGFMKLEVLLTGSDFPVGTPTNYLSIYTYSTEESFAQIVFSLPLFKENICQNPTIHFSCLDQMEIEGVVYETVYVCHTESTLGFDGTSQNVKTVYYSKEHGLLRMVLDNGDVWSLVK